MQQTASRAAGRQLLLPRDRPAPDLRPVPLHGVGVQRLENFSLPVRALYLNRLIAAVDVRRVHRDGGLQRDGFR